METTIGGTAAWVGGLSILGTFATVMVRNWVTERTKTRKATDQPVTLGEMQANCLIQHKVIGDNVQREITHVRELVQKDLDHGSERFDTLDEKVDKHTDALKDMGTVLQVIKEAVEGG